MHVSDVSQLMLYNHVAIVEIVASCHENQVEQAERVYPLIIQEDKPYLSKSQAFPASAHPCD